MVTYGGEQSLDRFLAISARGLPFNIAHAAGNAALALVAGPAMVRMLLRYRRRFEFAWKRLAPPSRPRARERRRRAPLPARRPADRAPALAAAARERRRGAAPAAAVAWLRAAQNGDGGFGFAPRRGVEPGDDRLGGARARGGRGQSARCRPRRRDTDQLPGRHRRRDPHDRRHRAHDPAAARRGTRSARTSRATTWSAGCSPGAAATAPGPAGQPDRLRHPRAEGRRGDGAGNSRSAAWLRDQQNDDGGWGFAAEAASDADSTGAVAAGAGAPREQRPASSAGSRYLRGVQRSGGGFALSGGPVNAQSTAWAAQGLVAAGVSPASVRKRRHAARLPRLDPGARRPLPLLVLQRPDPGLGHRPGADGGDGAAFPLDPVPRAVSNAPAASGAPAARQRRRGGQRRPSAGAKSNGRRRKPSRTTPPRPATSRQPVPSHRPPRGFGEDGGGGIPGWLIGLVIVAALGAARPGRGWVLYRRRLP